MAGCTQ